MLPAGAVRAMKALRHRVPEDASPEAAAIADEALDTVVEVMRGNVRDLARERLSAAALVREEVCGPVVKRLEHSGPGGEAIAINIDIGGTK